MATIDISEYFKRIGYTGSREPTLETLRRIHLAHTQSIPFENFDALLRRKIDLNAEALFRKLVVAGRGGWCFEQNGLFREVLLALGFEVFDLGARVLIMNPPARDEDLPSRTHRLMRVRIGGVDWLADVGFGGYTLDTPIRLVEGLVQRTERGVFSLKRVVKASNNERCDAHSNDECAMIPQPAEYILRYHVGGTEEGEPRDMYRFGLEPHYASDWEMANHYMCTFPGVIFQSMAMLSINERDGSKRTFSSSASSTNRAFSDAEAFRTFIYETFGIRYDDPTHGLSLDDFVLIAERAGVRLGNSTFADTESGRDTCR